jgi:hypothetical protein
MFKKNEVSPPKNGQASETSFPEVSKQQGLHSIVQ